MNRYDELQDHEKRLFNAVESIFINSSVSNTTFTKILIMVANKLN